VEPERRGLLVDWGGVMTTSLLEAFGAFCTKEGLEPQQVATLFRRDLEARRLLIEFETGRIDEADFEPGLARALRVANHDGLVQRLLGGARPEPAMHDAVRALRGAGVRTGMLSNSWGAGSYPRDLLPELFDVLVISGREGVRKPDEDIYAIARERMGLPYEQLVFVDDLPFNLDPARTLGMAVIHHTDPATTIARLHQLLGEPPGVASPVPRREGD
jgi:putative hydrolase of the HAD superfamily